MKNLGFIGLGIMGAPMAGHLQVVGHKMFLNSRGGVPKNLLDAGGVDCATAREVAEQADIIITMVPDTPHVEEVLFGEHGVSSGIAGGKIVGGGTSRRQGIGTPQIVTHMSDPVSITRIQSEGDGEVKVGQWGAAVDIDKAE